MPLLPTPVATPDGPGPRDGRVVARLLLLSGLFLAVQVLLTEHGDGRRGAVALALSYVVQAAPLLLDPVRRHVARTP